MHAMTDDEVTDFLENNSWATGIRVSDQQWLFYEDATANAISMGFPETPGRATFFAWAASLIGHEDELQFAGAVLWITLSGIGSPQLDGIGWQIIDSMRRGSGENRPIEVARGNWFRPGAAAELASFVLQCFVFGWDAWIVPSGAQLFVHISHDKFWTVVTRDEDVYSKAMERLAGCDPEPAPEGHLRSFCPESHIARKGS